MILAIEPVLNEEARRDLAGEHAGHEGELTGRARRLVQLLHQSYGSFIDVIVGDALYANGPFMTLLQDCGYDGVLVLKKENNEPFKEALALWQGQSCCGDLPGFGKPGTGRVLDAQEIQTLDSYRQLRVLTNRHHQTGKSSDHLVFCPCRTARPPVVPADNPENRAGTLGHRGHRL